MGGLTGIPQVLRDDVAHPGDLGELVADLRDREIEVLRTDEEDVVGLALPDGAEEARDELDEAAGLLELLVLLEQRDDVLQARVEGIRRRNLVRDGFGATVGHLRLRGFLELLAVGIGDVVNLGLTGQGFEWRLRRMS